MNVTADQQAQADAKAAADWERWWRGMSADERAPYLARGVYPADAAPDYTTDKRRSATVDLALHLIDQPPLPPLMTLPFSDDLAACFRWAGERGNSRITFRRLVAVIAVWFGPGALTGGGTMQDARRLAGMQPGGWRTLIESMPSRPRRKPTNRARK